MFKPEYKPILDNDYKKSFERSNSDGSNLSPLQIALDTRKFEIELYWKRATFFWAFIVAIYTAYFYVCSECEANSLFYQLLLSFLACCFSFLWYFSNRGSKFWQENWEAHVRALENEEIGPLYKTIKNPEAYNFRNIIGPFDFSVSKANIIASIIMVIVSILLFVKNVFLLCKVDISFFANNLQQACSGWKALVVILVVSAIIFFIIFYFSRGFASKLELGNCKHSRFITEKDSSKDQNGGLDK